MSQFGLEGRILSPWASGQGVAKCIVSDTRYFYLERATIKNFKTLSQATICSELRFRLLGCEISSSWLDFYDDQGSLSFLLWNCQNCKNSNQYNQFDCGPELYIRYCSAGCSVSVLDKQRNHCGSKNVASFLIADRTRQKLDGALRGCHTGWSCTRGCIFVHCWWSWAEWRQLSRLTVRGSRTVARSAKHKRDRKSHNCRTQLRYYAARKLCRARGRRMDFFRGGVVVKFDFINPKLREKTFSYQKLNRKIPNFIIEGGQDPFWPFPTDAHGRVHQLTVYTGTESVGPGIWKCSRFRTGSGPASQRSRARTLGNRSCPGSLWCQAGTPCIRTSCCSRRRHSGKERTGCLQKDEAFEKLEMSAKLVSSLNLRLIDQQSVRGNSANVYLLLFQRRLVTLIMSN